MGRRQFSVRAERRVPGQSQHQAGVAGCDVSSGHAQTSGGHVRWSDVSDPQLTEHVSV